MLEKILWNKMNKKREYARNISTVQMEVTNYCNLHCALCWRTLQGQDPAVKHISFEEFQKALDKLLSVFDIQELNTQGLGEPFLCPDIMKMLRFAKEKEASVWLVTNGTMITDTIARQLVEIGVDKVRISIDSVNKDRYAQIKSGSDLEQVKENIMRITHYKRELHRDYPALSLNSVVLKDTLCDLEDLIICAAELGIEEVTFIPLVSFGKGKAVCSQQIDLESDSFQEHFRRLQHIAVQNNIQLNLGTSMETKSNKFCHSGLYVDVHGDIHPCCNISQVNLGNIYKNPIESIVAKYTHFRAQLDKKDIFCKECNAIFDK